MRLLRNLKIHTISFLQEWLEEKAKRPEFNKRSELADKYLCGLKGIEIGAASYRNFNLNTLNIDICDNQKVDNVYHKEQIKLAGYVAKVDIIAPGDNLPFKDSVWDFVLTSHVLEHFFNPIKALKEWERVVKSGGYICLIVPDKRKIFDSNRSRTTLTELIQRQSENPPDDDDRHYNVWILEDILELCKHLNLNVVEYQEVDTKVEDAFNVIIKVDK